MTHIITISSPVIDVTYSEVPSHVQQDYSPFISNHFLGTFPLQDSFNHSPMVSIPSNSISDPECRSLHDPREPSVPSIPSYSDLRLEEEAATNAMSVLSPMDIKPPYVIPYIAQRHLHQADETTSETLPTHSPPGLSYSPTLSTKLHPQGLLESTNLPLSSAGASDQIQIQALPVAYPPLAPSMTSHGFDTAHALLHVPPAAAFAGPTTEHSNTVHSCECVFDGSPCNAQVNGNIRSIRNHLKRAHAFRGTGKDVIKCMWAGCENALQRENIPRHIVSCHLRVKVSCVECGLPLSRRDVRYSHAKACRARRQTAS